MIDAHGAAASHDRADDAGQLAVGILAQHGGYIGRQAPVLTEVIEHIGRRAQGGAAGKERLIGPDLGAAGVRRQRQIMVETDAHAGAACLLVGGIRLTVRLPLQIFVILDTLLMGLGKARHLGALAGRGRLSAIAATAAPRNGLTGLGRWRVVVAPRPWPSEIRGRRAHAGHRSRRWPDACRETIDRASSKTRRLDRRHRRIIDQGRVAQLGQTALESPPRRPPAALSSHSAKSSICSTAI